METIKQLGYTNLIHIAVGGEGVVYTCEKQGAKYIVKVVDALEDEQTHMLKRVNALRNECFPRIIEIMRDGEKTIIIREYIEGVTLADEIKKNGSFSYNRAKEILFDICSALRVLHAMKPHPIIYRDLKPDNVIITPEGKMKLIDFGIARYHKQESNRDTILAGTKGYTAPEVMAGMQSDVRSDIYSVGLVFYEMLSGRSLQDPPYLIRPVAESNEFLPSFVDEIIAKATDIKQMNRYANIDEFVYELENIKEIKAKQTKRKRRRRLVIALAILVLLAAAAVLVVPLLQQPDPEMILDLQFDSEEDAGWLEIRGENTENIVAQDCVKDGVFELQQEAVLKYALEPGKLLHIRTKAPDISTDGTMYMIDLNCADLYAAPRERKLWFRFYIGNNQPFALEPQKPEGYAHLTLSDSAMLGRAAEMVDVLIWLDDSDNSLRYFASDPSTETDISCIGVALDNEFLSEGWTAAVQVNTEVWNGAYSVSDLQTDIAFIRVSSGPVKGYLEQNIPAYTAHQERVDAFLAESMPLISELDYMPYG